MKARIKRVFLQLKKFNWSLWIALCVLALFPSLYQTIRTSLASIHASSEGIDIIGQMEWYDLIDETVKAFLVVPLYSLLNKIRNENQENLSMAVFKTMVIVFFSYFIFSLGTFFYGAYLIRFMNPGEVDIAAISAYLGLETIAFMIGIIPSFFNVVFVVNKKAKNVYLFVVIHASMGVIADFMLIPTLGVNGVACSNIITNVILSVLGFVILYLERLIRFSWFKKEDGKIITSWIKVGFFSGAQQLIDNVIYALMIGRMVNMVANQGNYWVANNFIYGWLLIPVFSLSEIMKADEQDEYAKDRRLGYCFLVISFVIVWAISIPLWNPFLEHIEKLSNHDAIFLILLKLVPFYLAYSLATIPDSIFISRGKTYLNTINSLFVNFLYYGIWFALYLLKAIDFTMDIIILMFGFGMVFHLLISWIEQYVLDNKEAKMAAIKKNDN